MTDARWTTLGVLLRETGGSIKTGPFGTALKAAEYSRQGVPVISVGEVGHGSLRITDRTRRVGQEVVQRLPDYVLRAGDVVFGRKGAVDRSALVHESEDGYFLGSDGIRVRLGATVDPRFIIFQLQSARVRDWLFQHAIGTTMLSQNQAVLERMPIRVPPIEEQHTVAQVLSETDGHIVALERLIAKKQEIKQGMMQRLLTGRTRLSGFDGTWRATEVGDVLEFRNGLNKAGQYFGSGTPIVNFMDVMRGPIITADDVVGRVTLTREEIKRFSANRGDIFFTRTSETVDEVGTAAALVDGIPDAVFSGFILRGRPRTTDSDPRFLAHLFHLDNIRKQVTATATYTTRALTNGRSLSRVSVELPSFNEQRAIADVIADSDAEIAALLARLDKARDIKTGMMQRLLTGRSRLPVQEVPA